MDVQYMSGTCYVYVRYLSGLKADIYRTSIGLLPHGNRSSIEAPYMLFAACLEGRHKYQLSDV